MFNFYYTLCILVLTIIFIVKFGKNNPLEMFSLPIKTYVITLENEKGKNKWNKIKQDNFMKFDGINGNQYNYQKEVDKNIIKTLYDIGLVKENKSRLVEMSKGEIGCLLSHYYLWKKIENEKNPVLILEDDTKIDETSKDKLNEILNHLPNDWDIYLLNFRVYNSDKDKVKDFVYTNAYLINPTSIKKIIKLLPIDAPIDIWLSKMSDKINIYHHQWKKGENSNIFNQDGLNSEIFHST